MFTFKQFLAEVSNEKDVEDLSAEELKKRARELQRRAQMKAAGQEERAEKTALRDLQVELRQTSDPRKKADLQRRIKELTTKKSKEGM